MGNLEFHEHNYCRGPIGKISRAATSAIDLNVITRVNREFGFFCLAVDLRSVLAPGR
jgi:hypothetical protein